jgi:hypothetical protein
VGAFIAAVAIGVGVGVLSMTPPDYSIARYCFIGSAVLLLVSAVHWLVLSTKSNVERAVLSAICGAAIVPALVFSLRWIRQREAARPAAHVEVAVDEIRELIKQRGEKYTREALLKKYPLGYVIFDLDYSNSVVPYDAQLPSEYKLDWKVVGFTSITKDRYELRLPDIYTKEGKPAMIGITTSCKKQVGGWQGGASIGDTDVLMWSEILAITDKGIVFLIGFEHVPGLNSSP